MFVELSVTVSIWDKDALKRDDPPERAGMERNFTRLFDPGKGQGELETAMRSALEAGREWVATTGYTVADSVLCIVLSVEPSSVPF